MSVVSALLTILFTKELKMAVHLACFQQCHKNDLRNLIKICHVLPRTTVYVF